ncbi:MAG: methyltransferase domain-containing protein [Acidobacteriota bacterium]|nr:methyltransferase domain-containing protein [Acidobacteriota bacterium]
MRGCDSALERAGRALVCPRGHSFDLARSGYVNLLQPQDRRSKEPGDSRAAAQARRRLTDAGHDAWMVKPILEALDGTAPGRKRLAVLDLGCGEGFLLGSLARARPMDAFGADISVPAIELAAKTHPTVTWVVSNADRRLPFADGSFDFVMSVTARRNGGELRRLLGAGGRALVVVPGEDDLGELREAVLGRLDRKDRAAPAIAELAGDLEPVSRRSIRRVARFGASEVRDLLAATYRGARSRERERAEKIGEMEVTLSRELLLFRRD